jgi:hypothetical protein
MGAVVVLALRMRSFQALAATQTPRGAPAGVMMTSPVSRATALTMQVPQM